MRRVLPLRLLSTLLATVSLSVFCTQSASAQTASDYPSRPITMVVPFPPGGGTDVAARALAARLSERLKQSVVIDNRGGAGGNIGAAIVAKSKADGYTLLFTAQSPITIAQHLSPKPTFVSTRDFNPIAIAVRSPVLVVVNSSLPVKSLSELATYSRQNPGKVFFGSPGRGTEIHLIGELIKKEIGAAIDHVAYRGSAPALTDLLSGQIQVMAASPAQVKPFIDSGRLRAIAVLSSTRQEGFPAVSTAVEGGWPQLEMEFWFGLLAPAGTPAHVINRLVKEIESIDKDADYKGNLKAASLESHISGPVEFSRTIKANSNTWLALIKTLPSDALE